MVLKNFSYDGQSLSEYDCMICTFGQGNSDVISNGSALTLETITSKQNYKNTIIDTSYESINITFSIATMNCQNLYDNHFTASEIANISKWLNRKTYHKFIPEYDEDVDDVIYYEGTFTSIQTHYIGGQVVGFDLTFTTNAPWGYVDYSIKKKNVTELYLNNDSDDIGILYPNKFNIKLLGGTGSGDNSVLKITNSSDLGHVTRIANCKQNEEITMDCIHEIIQSTNHSTLYNDFNYKFPRLKNTYYNSKNVITFSIPCDVEINYPIVRKVGIIV